jgi:hypothetical protein
MKVVISLRYIEYTESTVREHFRGIELGCI